MRPRIRQEQYRIHMPIYVSESKPPHYYRDTGMQWYSPRDGKIRVWTGKRWADVTRNTFWQRVCRKLFGRWIGEYWAHKNDRYACALLGLAQCNCEITPGMLARKKYLYQKCKWWGMTE